MNASHRSHLLLRNLVIKDTYSTALSSWFKYVIQITY